MMRRFVAILFFLVTTVANATEGGEKLVIEIKGVQDVGGFIAASLFHGREGFPSDADKALHRIYRRVEGNTVRWEISDIPPGEYAVILFHDEDSNQKLRTNFLGIPTEGLGISNNFKPRFGPPSFDDAKFAVGPHRREVYIDMQY